MTRTNLEERIDELLRKESPKDKEVATVLNRFGREYGSRIDTHVLLHEYPTRDGRATGISATKEGIISWCEPGGMWTAYASPEELKRMGTYITPLGTDDIEDHLRRIRRDGGDAALKAVLQQALRYITRGAR